jgi:hypothetical protein
MPNIPLPDIAKPLSRWTRHERTQFWVHLLPYMLFPFPEDEQNRNAVEMVLVAQFLSHLKRRIDAICKGNKKLNHLVQIYFNELTFFYENYGFDVGVEAESLGQLTKQEKGKLIKSRYTCMSILQYLRSMHEHHQEIIGGPSIRKAKYLIKLASGKNKLLYGNSTSISNAWSNYKPSIHIIAAYGLCRGYARKNSSETCRIDALDDIKTFLGLALHFQDVALSLSTGRQEKPVITPDEIWWLSNPFGVEKIEIPAKPLTDDKVAWLRGYKTEFSTK